MIIKIASKEQDALRYVCGLCDCVVSFYSIETNPEMVQAEIVYSNREEPSAAIAWYLGRQIECKIAIDEFKSR